MLVYDGPAGVTRPDAEALPPELRRAEDERRGATTAPYTALCCCCCVYCCGVDDDDPEMPCADDCRTMGDAGRADDPGPLTGWLRDADPSVYTSAPPLLRGSLERGCGVCDRRIPALPASPDTPPADADAPVADAP